MLFYALKLVSDSKVLTQAQDFEEFDDVWFEICEVFLCVELKEDMAFSAD